jgi:hypothetical protein
MHLAFLKEQPGQTLPSTPNAVAGIVINPLTLGYHSGKYFIPPYQIVIGD